MKDFARSVLFLAFAGLTSPVWLAVKLISPMERGNQSFLTGGQFMSLFPGRAGMWMRRAYYGMTIDSCGRDCGIGFGTWISNRKTRIGQRVYIGANCTIGMATIHDDVLIGSNVDILSGKHQHGGTNSAMPRNRQGGSFARVSIGANAWIGNSSVIMADVGADTVIGAGSVVVKPIGTGIVAAGNPARQLKTASTPNPPQDSH